MKSIPNQRKERAVIQRSNYAMNNLRYFRDISGVTPKQLSKLLNATVHTYIGFEQEKITIPSETVVMLSKIYGISVDEIFVPTEELDRSTEDTVRKYSELDDEQRFKVLCGNLTDGEKTNVTYRDVSKIRQAISARLRNIKAGTAFVD